MHLKSAPFLGVCVGAAILAFLAAPLSAQTTPTVAPPKCSDAGNPTLSTGYLPGHDVARVSTNDGFSPPTWTRNCGPAVVRVHLHGAWYRISGGRCGMGAVMFGAQVGLVGATPAAPAKSFRFAVSNPRHRSGVFRVSTATIQLLGHAFALPGEIATGTITIGKSMRNGTFALRLRDATRLTGSFTCG
jgi:hypothetical protein